VGGSFNLKVDDEYYLITTNTTTVLTIVTADKIEPDDSSAYTIVPFIPDQLIGAKLMPDNTVNRFFDITANDETTITINTVMVQNGTVTTGDTSAPYDTFIDTSKQSIFGDDQWNNYTCKFTSGGNNGISKTITDFIDSSGTFITEAFSAAINVSDTYEIHDDLLWVDNAMTFEIRGFIAPKPADFLDTTLAPIGAVFNKTVETSLGELNEANLPDYYNAIYSIVVTASKTATVTLNLECNDAIRITMRNQTTGDIQTIVESGFVPNTATEAIFHMVDGVKYRIDIAFYAETGSYGFRLGTESLPFGWYISNWESALPSPPDWVSITGSGDAGDPSAHDREIILRFKPPNDMFSVQPPSLGSA